MKVVVATSGKGGIDDSVSPVFGRCRTFTILTVENNRPVTYEIMDNPSMNISGGAGIQAARQVIAVAPKAVIAGNFGPNATAMLISEGIEIGITQDATADRALQDYLAGMISLEGEGQKRPLPAPDPGSTGRCDPMPANIPAAQLRFTCPECGCTMPKKPAVNSMKCPNCGSEMK